jgi:hypothetical protein
VCSHRAAIVDPKELGALFHATATYQGAPETVAALELAALTFVRSWGASRGGVARNRFRKRRLV